MPAAPQPGQCKVCAKTWVLKLLTILCWEGWVRPGLVRPVRPTLALRAALEVGGKSSARGRKLLDVDRPLCTLFCTTVDAVGK